MIKESMSTTGGYPPLPANSALFVDIDSLLATMSRDAGNYALGAPWTFGLLVGLRGRCGGALGIVTARPLKAVDRLLSPVLLAGIGQQGAELRLQFNQPSQMAAAMSPTLETALRTLLATAPFNGRTPLYVGDGAAAETARPLVEEFGGQVLSLEPHGVQMLRHWLRERRHQPRRPVPGALLMAQQTAVSVSKR